MASSIEYRVIKSLCEDLVNAISPSINMILNKAWSKSIISKEQLDTSIESNSSSHRKASTLVSAIANKVHSDKTNFHLFVDLLKDTENLEGIVQQLEDLHSKLTQEPLAEPASSTSVSRLDSRPQERKLELATGENVGEHESGLGEDSHDQEPIGSEVVTLSGEASGSTIHIPNRDSQKPFKSLFPSFVSIPEGENVLNYSQDSQMISPILEDGNTTNQSLVLAPDNQIPQATQRGPSLIKTSLEVINNENQSNLRKISHLQQQLTASKASEGKLIFDVQQLKTENNRLEQKLREKEQKAKQSKEMFRREIKDVKSKLQEKENEVIKLKQKLGKIERENEEQRQVYLQQIEQLQSERDVLQSKADSLAEEDEKNRKQLMELQEQVNEKNAQLNKAEAELNIKFREVCTLEVQLAKSQQVIAEQRADAAEMKLDSNTKDSTAEIKKLEDEVEFHKSNSVPKDMYNDCLKQMNELQTRLASASITPVDRQSSDSSLTESARPSPSSSAPLLPKSPDNETDIMPDLDSVRKEE